MNNHHLNEDPIDTPHCNCIKRYYVSDYAQEKTELQAFFSEKFAKNMKNIFSETHEIITRFSNICSA